MMKMHTIAAALCMALVVPPALAEEITAAEDGNAARQAVRTDVWMGSDADGNETRKFALGWDFSHRDLQHWWGAKVEQARFSGQDWSHRENRLYLSGAGEAGSWLWEGDVGSNGDDVIGRASLHSRDARRKEVFIEREVLETRGGTANGWVQTFAGATIDMPMGERWSASAVAGLQDFGVGDNLRTHLRGNLVFAVAPEQGVNLQLRGRFYRNSDPREADYYSPEWYGEALGVIGWRRHVGGYQYSARAGWGRQRSGGDDWKRARMLEASIETPRWKDAWLRLDAGYTDTPVLTDTGTGSYAYRYIRLQAVLAF
jgi:hypothetical protein